nr:16S rRNA (cytosine(967)-C(5))-methyltransferase RsmB [Eubacterium sp.]
MRKAVFDIVFETLERDGHSDEMFQRVTARSGQELTKQEKNFLRRVSYGVIERALELDRVIDHFSKTPVKKMKPVVRTILRMGVYELWYMDAIPASATCDEMVKLAKKKKFQALSGFVNGVLRNVARADKETLREELAASCKGQEERLAFDYAVPLDLVELLLKGYGKKTTKKILASYYEENPVTIRIQTINAQEEQVLHRLEAAGVTVEPCRYVKHAYHIREFESVENLPGFAEGHFTIQDESSMLPVVVSGIVPGNVVVDVCSSPGGKALHAVDALQGDGVVSARDVSEGKVARIEENAKRLRANTLEVKVWDGQEPDEAWREKADVVIVDVPCSGIGVIGRKPEIKYNAVANASELCQLQRRIVKASVTMMKPGGTLIYSTCTINPAENEENARWIEGHLSLKPVSLNDCLPESLTNKMTERGMLQILPGIQEGNGFFIAKFRKS